MDGICTLANDVIFDQLVALINSIESILGVDFPICIYPYDERVEKIKAYIASRPQVMLFEDEKIINKWDSFVKDVWDTHPTAKQKWSKSGSQGYHRFGTHRRYCAFDGPFARFIYMDGDTLLMGGIEGIFNLLQEHDCVVYDFQYKDPTHVYDVHSPKLNQVFTAERLQKEILCSGFYASKKGLFGSEEREWLLEQLKAGEAEILYPMAPDQTILNYMMMRPAHSIYNLALQLPSHLKTGCCVTSTHFTEKEHILYDKDVPLTYLHYIGIPSSYFQRLTQGEDIFFPYRDLFLYYRYLQEPEKRPLLTQPTKPSSNLEQMIDKVKQILGAKRL